MKNQRTETIPQFFRELFYFLRVLLKNIIFEVFIFSPNFDFGIFRFTEGILTILFFLKHTFTVL